MCPNVTLSNKKFKKEMNWTTPIYFFLIDLGALSVFIQFGAQVCGSKCLRLAL